MTSVPDQESTDTLWFLVHDLRSLPVFLARSRLQGWSDLESLVVHRHKNGCYVAVPPAQVGEHLLEKSVVGCERLENPPDADGGPVSMHDLVMMIRPETPNHGSRIRRRLAGCLVRVSEVAGTEIGAVLDAVESAGMTRARLWVEPNGHQWIHAFAAPDRRLPDWIPGAGEVLHSSQEEGLFVPPKTVHPLATSAAARFLPSVGDRGALVWDGDGNSGCLRVLEFEHYDLAESITWPEHAREVRNREPASGRRLAVGMCLEPDRRLADVRRAERGRAVMHVRTQHDRPSSGFLDLLDDGDAGVQQLVHYCLADESPYSKVDHYFLTARPVRSADLQQAAVTSIYIQPQRFGDFDVPVFVRLGHRLWPEVNWVLDGANDLPKFVRELTLSLGLDDGGDTVALLDPGESTDKPLLTILRHGRPVLENVDVLLEHWQPKLVSERLPSLPAVTNEAREQAVVALQEAAQSLKEQFDAEMQLLLAELDEALKIVDETDAKTRAAAARAESLHGEAIAVFMPLGDSWRKLVERLLDLNEKLQQERFNWIEGVDALRDKLTEQLEAFAQEQEDVGQKAKDVRDELEERRSFLETRDRSILGHLGHATTLENDIENRLGPKHVASIAALEQRIDQVDGRLNAALIAIRPKREELDRQFEALHKKHLALEAEKLVVDDLLAKSQSLRQEAKRQQHELDARRRLANAVMNEAQQMLAQVPQIEKEVRSAEARAKESRDDAAAMVAKAEAAMKAADAQSEHEMEERTRASEALVSAKQKLQRIAQGVRDEKASADKREKVVAEAEAVLLELEGVVGQKRRRGWLWRLKRMFVQ